MFAYGLLQSVEGGGLDDQEPFPRSSVLLAWRSVLGSDERAEAQKRFEEFVEFCTRPESDFEYNSDPEWSYPAQPTSFGEPNDQYH